MASAARSGARLVAWGGRLRSGVAASRRAVPRPGPWAAAVAGVALAGAGAAWHHGRVDVSAREGSLTVLAQKNVDCETVGKSSLRKQRFMQFSSLEHEGEYYMTPRDFLFSVMFEQMEQPHTGFHVAFKMLDADGNEMIEKKEFFKLQKIISKQDDLMTLNTRTECQEPTVKEPEINTTLQMRFFGKKGERKLHYNEFRRFMENLQTEVQEMEFLQFSKGLSFMRKEEFAEWLLFFTTTENKDIYWKNVREKLSAGESISLDEFKSFCRFTTHLEDFAIAMQMFSLAHRPVRLAEFKRAVKVATGQELSNNILDTVFKIFDLDGDECLSHEEFLGVLKNRMHRGLWGTQYKLCKVRKIFVGIKGIPHLVTHDARTISYLDPLIKVNDTIQIDMEIGKSSDFIKFDTGNLCMVTGGANLGRIGVITNR
ncbi:EF-hand domain-containing family member A1 [Tupaia chinensis]|uniref:EF-hand domain-containing family member A1 n=1 Tax=Tupaia chinensis TaxID=246437 RepID=L9JAP0_TUPCH|nr:EF-hand domain-containing family member A1 [Tupaia chinensis]